MTILRSCEGSEKTGFSFYCPGCKGAHGVWVSGQGGPIWGWNGSMDAPTFTPSLLIRTGHYIPGHEGNCWCTFNEKRRAEGKSESSFICRVCHSFITDGQIQFLGDCTHELAGQTVPIPEWPE